MQSVARVKCKETRIKNLQAYIQKTRVSLSLRMLLKRNNIYYLCRGGYIFIGVCLLTGLRKNIGDKAVHGPRTKPLDFGGNLVHVTLGLALDGLEPEIYRATLGLFYPRFFNGNNFARSAALVEVYALLSAFLLLLLLSVLCNISYTKKTSQKGVNRDANRIGTRPDPLPSTSSFTADTPNVAELYPRTLSSKTLRASSSHVTLTGYTNTVHAFPR